MGSSRPRNSTRAGKARSVKRTKSSGRRPGRLTAKPAYLQRLKSQSMSNGPRLVLQSACSTASTRPSAVRSKMPAESRLKLWRMQPNRPT